MRVNRKNECYERVHLPKAAVVLLTAGVWLLPGELRAAGDPQGPPDRVRLLVHFAPGADRGPARAFVEQHGAFVKYRYDAVLPNVVNVRNLPAEATEALARIPGVARVEEDKWHENVALLDESIPLIGALQSQITAAGYDADGTGVRVCIVDTGIDSDHTMYSARIDTAAGWDFYNDDPNPEDDYGHGSHVAGIAVGRTGMTVTHDPDCEVDKPFQGVAPNATLIGVKVLSATGGGYESDIIAGINHCASPTIPGGRADVINLSLGYGDYNVACDGVYPLADAANNAVDLGVVVVAAAGNDAFYDSLVIPACASKVISVGATYKIDYPNCEYLATSFSWCMGSLCETTCIDEKPKHDQVVCMSNHSEILDVTAPGALIWSAGINPGGTSLLLAAGTSMAAPHAAGLAALILDLNPGLTPAEVRQIIRDGAIDLGNPGHDRAYGYGRIDVLNSLALAVPPVCGNANCQPGENKCICPQDCGTPPATETSCTNGLDDDCDTFIDCEDSNCATYPTCVCDNDGHCDPGENCNNCSGDCTGAPGAACGNGVCEAGNGEDCVSCPADCRGLQTGPLNKQFCCGDGGGVKPVTCADSRCTTAPYACTSTPVVGYCCGDATCGGAETKCNCSLDCGTPAASEVPNSTCTNTLDDDCDGLKDCADGNCASDPACMCKPSGATCTANSECCSNSCRRGKCR